MSHGPQPQQSPETPGPPEPDSENPAVFPSSSEEDKAPIQGLPPSVDAGSTRTLASLMLVSPFLSLHRNAGGDHPKRAAVCFFFDFLLRLLAVSVVVVIVGAAAWKMLASLPPLWQ